MEVVIVDNGSTDGSIELAESSFGKDSMIRIVRLKGNVGLAAGNNIGVRYCRREYVVFLKNDTVVDRMWITELVKVMEKRPDRSILTILFALPPTLSKLLGQGNGGSPQPIKPLSSFSPPIAGCELVG